MTQDHTVVYAPSEEAGHDGDVVAAETRSVDLDDNIVWAGFRGFDIARTSNSGADPGCLTKSAFNRQFRARDGAGVQPLP